MAGRLPVVFNDRKIHAAFNFLIMPLYHSDGRCRPDLGMVHKAEVIEKTVESIALRAFRLGFRTRRGSACH